MTQSSVAPPSVRPRLFQRHWTWWFMVAALVVVAAVRLRLLNFPLERDEGEYAYAGQGASFGHLLVYHITHAVTLVDPATNPVSPMENMPLAIATSWRSAVQTNPP